MSIDPSFAILTPGSLSGILKGEFTFVEKQMRI